MQLRCKRLATRLVCQRCTTARSGSALETVEVARLRGPIAAALVAWSGSSPPASSQFCACATRQLGELVAAEEAVARDLSHRVARA